MPKDKKGAETEDVFEMEDIINFKREHNTDFYLIKWQGYGEEDATWEPRRNIMDPDAFQKKKMLDLKNKWLEQTGNTDEESSSAGKKRRRTTDIKNGNTATNLDKGRSDDEISNKKLSSQKEKSKTTTYERSIEEDGEKGNTSNSLNNKVERRKEKDNNNNALMKSNNEENKNINTKFNTNNCKNNASDSSIISNLPKLPRVVHIREREGSLQVLMETDESTKEREDVPVWLDMSVARDIYSQELLDYLLARLRFKRHSS